MTGAFNYISTFDFSVDSPINISHKGDKITFIADNNVYVFDIASGEVIPLTNYQEKDLPLVGAPVFSRKDDRIAFNQFVDSDNRENVQIKLIIL